MMFGGFVKLLRHCGGFTRLACIDGFEPHLVHGVGDFVESFGPESGVHVECDACGGVAELLLQGLDIRAAGDGDGSVGVTEAVDVHAFAFHAGVAHAGIPDACPPAVVVDVSAAFGPEQELVLALSGGLLLQLGNERLRQGDGPRLTVFCVPSCILPSPSSDHVRRMRALRFLKSRS